MLNKIYDEIKEIIYKNYKLFISFFIILFTLTLQLPFYINSPGGIIDISDKIKIENQYDVEGSFNFAYVSELKATIPTLIFAYFNKNWDVLPKEEVVYENETVEDVYFRSHLLLEEANQTAIILAYKKANKKITINNQQLFVTYVDPDSKTNLRVGDELIEVQGKPIKAKQELTEILSNMNVGDNLSIKVKKENKIINKSAQIIDNKGDKVIGIMVSKKLDLVTDPKIDFNFEEDESGPSGGLMMALAIYNYLTKDDITSGKRIVGTGTVDEQGNVGSIGGVEYKLKGVVKEDVEIFLVPAGKNYKEATKLKEENNYDIEIVPISTFEEAIDYLNNL